MIHTHRGFYLQRDITIIRSVLQFGLRTSKQGSVPNLDKPRPFNGGAFFVPPLLEAGPFPRSLDSFEIAVRPFCRLIGAGTT